MIVWNKFDVFPEKPCNVVIGLSDGRITSGKYDGVKFISDFETGRSFEVWRELSEDWQNEVMFLGDTIDVIEFSDENEEPWGLINGWGIRTEYNFGKIKTEDDVKKVASSMASFFYEDMINKQ